MLVRIRDKIYKARGAEAPDATVPRGVRSLRPQQSFRFGKPSVRWIGSFVSAFLAVAVVIALLASNHALTKPSLNEGRAMGSTCLPASGTTPSAVGNITKYMVPGNLDSIGDITFGPGCSLWFVAQKESGSLIGKVTTSGEFTEYSVPNAPSRLGPITAGPDGNVWFIAAWAVPGLVSGVRLAAAGKVSRLTASGSFTEYVIPAANTSPMGIASGPDGNIWFTDPGTNQVVKVTSSGAFTAYPIPTPNSQPGAITAGPDGNLWFVESHPGKLARVTTSGRITEFAGPANNVLVGIASGPDGNLWITERGRFGGGGPGKVAKMTVSGAFTEYNVPLGVAGAKQFSPAAPSIITAGRDGNLWFLEGHAIYRITTSGFFTEYPVVMTGPNTLLRGIAAGPDGNIWFTEQRQGQLHQVGRLVAL